MRVLGGGLVVELPCTSPVQPASAKLHTARKIAAIDCGPRPAHFDECVLFVFTLCSLVPEGGQPDEFPNALQGYRAYLLYVTGRKQQKRVVVLMEARPVHRGNAGRDEGQVKNSGVRFLRDRESLPWNLAANLTARRAREEFFRRLCG